LKPAFAKAPADKCSAAVPERGNIVASTATGAGWVSRMSESFSLKPLRLFGQRIRPWACLHHLRIAAGALVGKTVGDRFIVDYVSNRAELAGYIREFESQIPQAQVADESVTRFDYTDWRVHFGAQLTGDGLEIGALHDPTPVPAARSIRYVDRLTSEALRAEAPEVAARIGRVDIIDDAQTLATVTDASCDFVIAAHVIEHLRNPIGALRQWLRVLRPGGRLYLVAPDKRRTFDRARVRTTIEHLILDDQEPSAERDFEHFLDYAVHVHKASRDAALAEARRLAAADFSIHFHTFIPRDMVALVEWIDAQVTPVRIVEGPAMSPENLEFHLLLQRP
jgi:SAM-dependent methyltransferase